MKKRDPYFGQPCVTTCCLCLRYRAVVYGGHVTRGSERILAGWCRRCHERLEKSCSTRLRSVATWTISKFVNCPLAGWYGHWLPEMGQTTWGEVEKALARARAAAEWCPGCFGDGYRKLHRGAVEYHAARDEGLCAGVVEELVERLEKAS